MVLYEEQQFVGATCGVGIDDENILWTEWKDGNLYRLNIKSYDCELVGIPNEFGHCGKMFSSMIKNREKVYMIAYSDAYEVMEYDINSNKLRLLYLHMMKGIQIFNSFLVEDNIYLFPSSLAGDICIYSLKDNKADYISWEHILLDINCCLKDKVINVNQCGENIYGVICDTSYVFRLSMLSGIKCDVYQLDEKYKVGSVSVVENDLYITLMEHRILLCINQDGEVREIKCFESEEECEETENYYSMSVIIDQEIFLFPFEGNNEIQIVNRQTMKQRKLIYPNKFKKRRSGRFFWKPILFKNYLYLLPYSGNGILHIEINGNKIEYVKWKNKGICAYIDNILASNKIGNKEFNMNLGKAIYQKVNL